MNQASILSFCVKEGFGFKDRLPLTVPQGHKGPSDSEQGFWVPTIERSPGE